MAPASLVTVCNEALGNAPCHANVRLSAARWTPKGNLVVVGGPATSLAQLKDATSLITNTIQSTLPEPTTSLASRANVKWSKLLINGVPTGISDRSRTAPPRGAAGKGKDKAETQGAGLSKGKAPSGRNPPPVQKATYAAATAATLPSPPKPPHASLVISLPDATSAASLYAQSATRADMMAMLCIETLAAHPTYADVKVSAAKWTPKGNLVVFGGPNTPQDCLLATSHILTSAISAWLAVPGSSCILARTNVKWSKVLINGVPLFGAGPATSPAPSAALHASLVDNNPSYKALKITQMPSWVRAPATYQPTQEKLSLVVAFEDPDGSIARDLIKAKSLFVFGVQATVKKWKYKAPHPNQ